MSPTYTLAPVVNNTLSIGFTPASFSLCPGDSAIIIPSGAASYDVLPGGYTTINPFMLQPTASTTYTITGTLGLCKVTRTLPGMVYTPPTAGFSTHPIDKADGGDTLKIVDLSMGANQWAWDFGDGSPIVTTQHPGHTYDVFVSTTYTISQVVTNADGCVDSAKKTIRINPLSTLYVPNAFTPNGDGLNDVFGAQGNAISSLEMWIYDRWGHLVFHTTDMNRQWNGEYNGSSVKQGTFSYKICWRDFHNKFRVQTGIIEVFPEKN